MIAHHASTNVSRRFVRALAGLGCAVLFASCAGTTEISGLPEGTAAPTASQPASPQPEPAQPEPTAVPTESPATILAGPTVQAAQTAEAMRQVLVVTQVIYQGTLANEISDAPSTYLTADLLPADLILPSAIGSIAELQELNGFILSADVLPGEQLLRSSFIDMGLGDSPQRAAIATPAGHDATVLTLPPDRAVAGLIRAGEYARVVATSVGADGQAVSITLLDKVEVLSTETIFGDAAAGLTDPVGYGFTIAVEPDEASALAAALAESAIITLAAESRVVDGYAVVITMTQARALQGEVRMGDAVDVVSVPSRSERGTEPVAVAAGLEVLTVLSDGEPQSTDTNFSVVVAVSAEELLAVTAAVANGPVSLAESS